MNLPDKSYIEDVELRIAYDCAKEVHETLHRQRKKSREDRYVFELSAFVSEAMISLDTNTKLPSSSFDQMSSQVSNIPMHGVTPLIRLGYSLTILLRRLLMEKSGVVSDGLAVFLAGVEPSSIAEGEVIKQEPLDETEKTQANSQPKIFEKEIKEEPMDEDALFDSNQDNDREEDFKEEPISDVFCPTTDDSLPNYDQSGPFGSSTISRPKMRSAFPQLRDDERIVALSQIPRPTLRSALDDEMRASTSTGAGGQSVAEKLKMRAETRKIAEKQASKSISQRTRALPNAIRKCYICGKSTTDYCNLPANPAARDQFLSSIKFHFERDRQRIEAAAQCMYRPCFCRDHLVLQPRLQATPILTNRPPPATQQPPTPVKAKCDVCFDPIRPFRLMPVNRTKAHQLLNELNITVAQHRKMAAFIDDRSHNRQALVCQRHFKPRSRILGGGDTSNAINLSGTSVNLVPARKTNEVADILQSLGVPGPEDII